MITEAVDLAEPAGEPPTRVLLVDDQRLIRAGLRRVLEFDRGIQICAECSDGSEVLEAVLEVRPDVVLMDIRMSVVDGDVAIRLLRQSIASPPPVLALTAFDSPETIALVLDAGASGFLRKEASAEQLTEATRAVAGGGYWLDPSALEEVLRVYRSAARSLLGQTRDVAQLTDRECEVLCLIAHGASNAEVAGELIISEATVKSHFRHVLAKLDLRDRPGAIVFAFDSGLVQPRPLCTIER